MSESNLNNANLANADLTEADLKGTSFLGADLSGAKFLHADLFYANFRRSIGLKPDQIKMGSNWEGAIYDEGLCQALGLPNIPEPERREWNLPDDPCRRP
jgi:uncharacterized protein YjbI with pentapeptide repeats